MCLFSSLYVHFVKLEIQTSFVVKQATNVKFMVAISSSVAPICKFADIPIHRYLFPNTADTDADTDVFYIIIIKQRLMNQQVKMKI